MKIHFLLILIFLSGCFPPKKTSELKRKTVFDDPHFFYDKDNYTLIRVNPETRKEDIEEYMNLKNKISSSSTSEKGVPENKVFWTPPQLKKIMRPFYPREAKLKGYQTEIILKLKIDSTGVVTVANLIVFETQFGKFESKLAKIEPKKLIKNKSEYIKEPDKIEKFLIVSALELAIQYEFIPAYNDEGKPVPIWVSIPIIFKFPEN